MKLCMGCMSNIEDHASICPYCGYSEAEAEQEAYYLTPGTIIGGKYIVGKAISYGGFFVSYIGMDAEVQRKVTIKEYLPSDFTTRSAGEKEITIYSGDALEQFEEGLSTFLNEGNRIQQSGTLPGIATVYDCVAENDTGYIISEYLEGRTLKEILDKGKTYTAKETYEFACTLLGGLAKLHRVQVVHCDIAPENIVLTDDGQIKLIDFGAIRYATTSNSKSLAVILKQGYAPEEQYRSKGEKGPWSDVYSVAAVMYRMMTGRVPDESVERALTDKLQEPSKLGIDIPSNMENAIMNALNVFQGDRTPSAEAFLAELSNQNVKRNKVKIKADTGKFPLWAKGLVAGLLLAALAGGAFVVKNLDTEVEVAENKDSTSVLSVKGKPLEEAKKMLGDSGFADPKLVYKLGEQSRIVTQQIPDPGSVISKDSVITLYVENKNWLTLEEDVPNCSKSRIRDLCDDLKKIGIVPEIKTKESSRISKDNLIQVLENGEEFPYGTYVEAGRKLTFVISEGSTALEQNVAEYVHKQYDKIKDDKNFMIRHERAEDDCVPQPEYCFGDGSEYKKGEIAYQTIFPGKPYNKDFKLYAIKEIIDSSGCTVKDFKYRLQTIYHIKNVSCSAGDGETDFQWEVTNSGIEGLSPQKRCFSSDAEIRIWKETPTPAPEPTAAPVTQPQPKTNSNPNGGAGSSNNHGGGQTNPKTNPNGNL